LTKHAFRQKFGFFRAPIRPKTCPTSIWRLVTRLLGLPQERGAQAAALWSRGEFIQLLGRDVPVLPAADGSLRAEDNGKPAAASGVRTYIARAFGNRLPEVYAAMETLAASLPPDELNRVGFRPYEHFRPDVSVGAQGWRAKGVLHVERILSAASVRHR